MNRDDLIGRTFNNLTVIGTTVAYRQKLICAVVKCKCGRQRVCRFDQLLNGNIKSCGCLNKARSRVSLTCKHSLRWEHRMDEHGNTRPEYSSWSAMMGRCLSPEHPEFENYGKRGISVCEKWRDFDIFFNDMGPRPSGTTLDRINFNKGYEPGNCRWANKDVQANNRSACVFYEYGGRRLTIKQWSNETGIKYKVLHSRLRKYKWSFEKSISEPVKQSTIF